MVYLFDWSPSLTKQFTTQLLSSIVLSSQKPFVTLSGITSKNSKEARRVRLCNQLLYVILWCDVTVMVSV